jgi:hypothetical protein
MPRLGCIKILGEIIYEISKNASNNSIEKFPTKKMLSMNSFFSQKCAFICKGHQSHSKFAFSQKFSYQKKIKYFSNKRRKKSSKINGIL